MLVDMKIFRFFLFIFLSFLTPLAWGQAPEVEEVADLPKSYLSKVDRRITFIGDQITGKSTRYFSKFKTSDRKIRKKLKRINADLLIKNTDESFRNVAEKSKKEFYRKNL